MGGGLMQLVAYGAQDIYLTGNPQITYFKVVYRRHTNFAIEAIDQTYNGMVDWGRKFTVTIARNGDLLHRIYLEMDVSNNNGYSPVPNGGFQTLDYVELEIGGQVIDKQYGEWMAIWTDLSHTFDQRNMLENMLSPDNTHYYVPLQFWFCRNTGLALPLIALQYHEVKINIQMAKQPYQDNSSIIGILNVWCDYIFLDTDERRRFAQVSHEYLIEQVQFTNTLSSSVGSNQQTLLFNHPVKELVWIVQDNNSKINDNSINQPNTNVLLQYADGVIIDDAVIQLNGQDRFKRRRGDYFTKVQRYEKHTGTTYNSHRTGVHIYSFGLKPEDHQPSGTCNFSRIDSAIINYNVSETNNQFKMYAVNYNVLRIMSGMGGLAYSN